MKESNPLLGLGMVLITIFVGTMAIYQTKLNAQETQECCACDTRALYEDDYRSPIDGDTIDNYDNERFDFKLERDYYEYR